MVEIKEVKCGDKDYPQAMMLVHDKEKYHIMRFANVDFVPLFQVIDLMAGFKPNYEWRNGVRYCANCGATMDANMREVDDG